MRHDDFLVGMWLNGSHSMKIPSRGSRGISVKFYASKNFLLCGIPYKSSFILLIFHCRYNTIMKLYSYAQGNENYAVNMIHRLLIISCVVVYC